MGKTIHRPLRRIRVLTNDTSRTLFELSCAGGRAKYVEASGILTFKIHIADDAAGRKETLGALGVAGASYDLDVSAGGEGAAPMVIRFKGFTPSKVELRSFATSLTGSGVWMYFVEGYAGGVESRPVASVERQRADNRADSPPATS